MPLKICFLSILHPYNDTRIFHKEARSLVKAGFDVTHLAAGQRSCFVEEGVKIQLYSSLTRNPILGRLARLWPLFTNALKINADCYHCNEIESWIVGCLIKLIHPKKRIIFDVHEHYPSFFENPFYPRWVRLIGEPIILLLYRLLTPITDFIVVVLPSLSKDFRNSDNKIVVVANYALLEFRNPQLDNIDFQVTANFQNGKTAIHTGSIARSRGWPELLIAISQMKYPDLNILFLGDIPNGEEILAEAERLGVSSRVKIKEKVSYEQMMDYLFCADIGLILYLPDVQNHIIAWPTKFCDYMIAGLPVIAPQSMERVADAINENQTGLLVDPSKPDEIANALDFLCLNAKQSALMGERGIQAVKDKYNWEVEAKKLVYLYQRIAEGVQSE